MAKDKAAQSQIDNTRKRIGEHTRAQQVKTEKRIPLNLSRSDLEDGSKLILYIFTLGMTLLSVMVGFLAYSTYTAKPEL